MTKVWIILRNQRAEADFSPGLGRLVLIPDGQSPFIACAQFQLCSSQCDELDANDDMLMTEDQSGLHWHAGCININDR